MPVIVNTRIHVAIYSTGGSAVRDLYAGRLRKRLNLYSPRSTSPAAESRQAARTYEYETSQALSSPATEARAARQAPNPYITRSHPDKHPDRC